jgi:hypothetical protein
MNSSWSECERVCSTVAIVSHRAAATQLTQHGVASCAASEAAWCLAESEHMLLAILQQQQGNSEEGWMHTSCMACGVCCSSSANMACLWSCKRSSTHHCSRCLRACLFSCQTARPVAAAAAFKQTSRSANVSGPLPWQQRCQLSTTRRVELPRLHKVHLLHHASCTVPTAWNHTLARSWHNKKRSTPPGSLYCSTQCPTQHCLRQKGHAQ